MTFDMRGPDLVGRYLTPLTPFPKREGGERRANHPGDKWEDVSRLFSGCTMFMGEFIKLILTQCHPLATIQPMNPIFLIIGPPAVGKSTTSRALAARFPRSLHIPVDDLRNMVVSGQVLPGAVWSADLAQQLNLARMSAAQMALAYQAAGFVVVIDDFWDEYNFMTDYQELLRNPHLHKIILYPGQAEAHQRNLGRSGDSPARAYIDEGIQIVYSQLGAEIPRLEGDGWSVVDTTTVAVEETVEAILNGVAGGSQDTPAQPIRAV
jgi:hypothetical protein